MPLFKYQCEECGLRFSRLVSSKNKDSQSCVDCQSPVELLLPDNVNGSFNLSATGPVPQNTGVSDFDANVDRVIGKSSEQGWDHQNNRYRRKLDVLSRNPGKDGQDIAINPDGSYRVLAEEEKAASSKAHGINNEAMRRINRYKRSIRSPTVKES